MHNGLMTNLILDMSHSKTLSQYIKMKKHQVTLFIVVIVALTLFFLNKKTVTENYRNYWERMMEQRSRAREAARRRARARRTRSRRSGK